jgi:hypothetical protein
MSLVNVEESGQKCGQPVLTISIQARAQVGPRSHAQCSQSSGWRPSGRMQSTSLCLQREESNWRERQRVCVQSIRRCTTSGKWSCVRRSTAWVHVGRAAQWPTRTLTRRLTLCTPFQRTCMTTKMMHNAYLKNLKQATLALASLMPWKSCECVLYFLQSTSPTIFQLSNALKSAHF